jgi:hypothetical protein
LIRLIGLDRLIDCAHVAGLHIVLLQEIDTAILTARRKRRFRAPASQQYDFWFCLECRLREFPAGEQRALHRLPLAVLVQNAATNSICSSLAARAHTTVSPLRINHPKFSQTLLKVCGSSEKL